MSDSAICHKARFGNRRLVPALAVLVSTPGAWPVDAGQLRELIGHYTRGVMPHPCWNAPGGLWLSLIGSTEGPPREVGPPRRSARELILAIEPALEIVELRTAEFRNHGAKAWFCLARRRI